MTKDAFLDECLEVCKLMPNFVARKQKTDDNMFGTIIALAFFFGAALVGWAIAELKGNACEYVKNEDEEKEDQRQKNAQ